MRQDEDEEWTLTVVHEVGHAVVAMHYGAPGRLDFDLDGEGLAACAVERRHEPTGREGVHYGYAGAAAELLWLHWDGERRFDATDCDRFALLGIIAWPSAEDFMLIGDRRNVRDEVARTKTEFLETCSILRGDWPKLVEMVDEIAPSGKGKVYWFMPGMPFPLGKSEGSNK